MKTEYIPKVITLLAGAVVCIISIVRHMDTTYSLEILLAALIIFYIIGCITRRIIEKVMTSNRFIKEVTDETEKVQDGSEDTGDADNGENDVQSQES
ncbi:hypothetical protein [Jutongia huaianensis]|jgi:hypothetical protein|uniref:Uncharacterized protein n=1 Tax=Jutongia huaianensis TaxID=2763668 RepID=A0ABR7N4V3_9FIRM|nr:hypothetical protein [Jutongia huaianensis]MBC8563048.1 hypothetical protein [Jutongia huaianensis]RHV08300.1 hypothetical protein DXB96_00495 [Clostridium sp. OM07-10AC]